MKKLITSAALGLALVAGNASADKLALMDEQLDNVNAGFAFAVASAGAGAAGNFVSVTATNTTTIADSLGPFFNLSISQSDSASFAI